MDGATIGAILAAGKSGGGVVASHARARQAAQDAQDARDRVTAATLPEIYALLGLGNLATATASGPVAAFETNINLPVKDLHIGIEPVQNLNGYDHPWPGGGGKNLLDFSKLTTASTAPYGMLFTKGTAEGTVVITGTLEKNGSVAPLSYADTSLSGKGYVFLTEHISGDSLVQLNATYGLRTETEKAIAVKFNGVAGQTYTETIRISVYNPPAPTSWTPYSNICPITGWSGVKLQRTGKNLIPNIKTQSGANIVVLGSTQTGAYDMFLKAGTYTLTVDSQKAVSIYIGTAGAAGLRIGVTPTASFTLENDASIRLWLYSSSGISTDDVNSFQLKLGSTATDYEPYQGSTYDLSFGSAGTVYGGTLDVNTGLLTVDRAVVDLGTLNWVAHITYGFYSNNLKTTIKRPSANTAPVNALCSGYTVVAQAQEVATNGSFACDTSGIIYIHDDNYSDAATFKTAMSGVQLVYELAEPQTYHLTPLQVRTLIGQNHIWADTGETAVTYYRQEE